MSAASVQSTDSPTVPKRWLAFSAALMAMMMDLLDSTITQVAGPSIQRDLGGSYADLQWIAAAYTLALAVMLLTGGRLGDMFGRKRILMIGAAGFTVASVACAVAPSMDALIVSRALQGAVGAIMIPQVFGLIRDLFGPADMGKAWAVLGPVAGLSAVLGPIISGLLIEADLFGTGWRMLFLINIPVGAYVLIVGGKLLPAGTGSTAARGLDLTGTVLATAATVMLVFPLVQGREQGWPVWMLVLMFAAVPVLFAFARHQVARKRAGRVTLIEPSVFSNRSYVGGVAFAMVFLGSMGGLTLALGMLLQIGLHEVPITAALITAPYALGGFVGSAVAGIAAQKVGRPVLHAGLAIKVVGLVWLVSVLDANGAAIGSWDFTAPLLVAGIGMGMVFVPLFDIILAGVKDEEVGSASGVLQSMQSMGMSLGIAGLGTLFFSLAGAHGAAGFVDAAERTILIAAGLLVVAFVIGFALPRQARPEPASEPAAPGVRPEPVLA